MPRPRSSRYATRAGQMRVGEVVSADSQIGVVEAANIHGAPTRTFSYLFPPLQCPHTKKTHGRPRPELIALATWDVFGRFSVTTTSAHGILVGEATTHRHIAYSCRGIARPCLLSLGHARSSRVHSPTRPTEFLPQRLATLGTASILATAEESTAQPGHPRTRAPGPRKRAHAGAPPRSIYGSRRGAPLHEQSASPGPVLEGRGRRSVQCAG